MKLLKQKVVLELISNKLLDRFAISGLSECIMTRVRLHRSFTILPKCAVSHIPATLQFAH
jgi:hypothetical protein